MIKPMSSSVVKATKNVSTAKQKLQQVRRASNHYGNIAFQHEKQIKYLTAIVASFLLVLQRVFTAWKTAWTAQTPESRKFSKKEAYRTTLREFGGFTFSYALLKMIEKKYTQHLEGSVGIRGKGAPPSKTNALPSMGSAVKGWVRDMKAIIKGTPSETEWKPSKIYRANAMPPLSSGNFTHFKARYNTSSSFRRWVNLFQPGALSFKKRPGKTPLAHNHLKTGKTALELFKPFLKNAPMVVGGLTALGLSGFFLEWLTINKMDTITQWLSGSKHTDEDPLAPSNTSANFAPALASMPLRNDGTVVPAQPDVLTSWDVYDTFSQPFTAR